MEGIEVKLGEGKEDGVILIEADDLNEVQAALKATASVYGRWAKLEPKLCAYAWCGNEAFEDSESEQRKALHKFLKVETRAWAQALSFAEKAKNAAKNGNEDAATEARKFAAMYRNEASTLASTVIARMTKYHNQRMQEQSEGEEGGTIGPRARKSVRTKAEEFSASMAKLADKENLPILDRNLAREIVNAMRTILSGQGIKIPVFEGMPTIDTSKATHPTVGDAQRKPSDVTILKGEEAAAALAA